MRTSRKPTPNPLLHGTLHDQRTLVTGSLERMSDAGAELVSHGNEPDPLLPLKARIVLSIVNESSQKAVTIPAKLIGIVRREGAWVYRIRWSEALPAEMVLRIGS